MSGAPSGALLPFGAEAAAYEAGRPDYPPALYEALFQQLGLTPGLRGFEAGAGTGLATRALLARGLRVQAIEPDPGMAAELARNVPGAEVLPLRMEEVCLPPGSADFGVSAMAMHWMTAAEVLPLARSWLKPGAGFAMWWTIFGDPARPDAFQRASAPVFAGLGQGRGFASGTPYGLRSEERLAELTAAGFRDAEVTRFDWTIRQNTAEVVALCRSFSPVLQMPAPAREAFLAAITALVEREFGGQVERAFCSVLYSARNRD